jgi:hypothetical protein
MRFAIYGAAGSRSISLDEIVAEQQADQMLFAHAEDSGCESCYVEVAKWSNSRKRWERYAFCKCLDYRLPEMPDASDEDTAIEAARRINEPCYTEGRASVVHTLPNCEPEPVTVEQIAAHPSLL